jgi:glutaredoxin 2
MHDPNRHLGVKKRKGYNTTHRTKLESCAKFKALTENKKLDIRSKNLVHELKYFVAKGTSYEASLGEHDDLVSAMLLNIRMVQHIATWDDEVHTQMASNIGGKFEEENEDPLPMLIL